ncbi:MAG: hypothetical protein ACI81R_003345 [Bradymonadia bacterium]|jgi:uncharacterized protein YdcH (DUF465 family)
MSETVSAGSNQDSERSRLEEEHALLHKRIEELEQQLYLSPQKQMLRKRLKKLKLSLKDRLSELP